MQSIVLTRNMYAGSEGVMKAVTETFCHHHLGVEQRLPLSSHYQRGHFDETNLIQDVMQMISGCYLNLLEHSSKKMAFPVN